MDRDVFDDGGTTMDNVTAVYAELNSFATEHRATNCSWILQLAEDNLLVLFFMDLCCKIAIV